jgi:hypothetical protein
MRPRYKHLYVVAFSIDSDDRDGGSPVEIMRALQERVRELEETGEILEAVGVPDETIDYERASKSKWGSRAGEVSEASRWALRHTSLADLAAGPSPISR